jgi:hypothetical protein
MVAFCVSGMVCGMLPLSACGVRALRVVFVAGVVLECGAG